MHDLLRLTPEPDIPDALPEPRQRTVIEKNGSEYLVTINGCVFLALSLAGAAAIARRLPHGSARSSS